MSKKSSEWRQKNRYFWDWCHITRLMLNLCYLVGSVTRAGQVHVAAKYTFDHPIFICRICCCCQQEQQQHKKNCSFWMKFQRTGTRWGHRRMKFCVCVPVLISLVAVSTFGVLYRRHSVPKRIYLATHLTSDTFRLCFFFEQNFTTAVADQWNSNLSNF